MKIFKTFYDDILEAKPLSQEVIDERNERKLKRGFERMFVNAILADNFVIKPQTMISLFQKMCDFGFPPEVSFTALNDTNIIHKCFHVAAFKKFGGDIYYFCEDFFNALMGASLDNVSFDSIPPAQKFGQIIYPNKQVDRDGEKYQSILFSVTNPTEQEFLRSMNESMRDLVKAANGNGANIELPPMPDRLKEKATCVSMTYETEIKNTGRFNYFISDFSTLIKDVTGLERVEINGLKNSKSRIDNVYSDEIRAFMNSIIYLASGEPDLRSYRNDIKRNGKKPVAKCRNLIDREMILVGFDYKKSKLYQEASSYRKGHMYWQAYGPKWSLRRLRWRRDAEVCYKNVKEGAE